MVVSDRILDAERRAKERGFDVPDLCAAAGVHRATWQRWKISKGQPGVEQWDAVEALLQRRAA